MASLPFTQVGASYFPPRRIMTAGQYLLSPTGKYKLLLHGDGNLAMYDAAGAFVWVANESQQYSHSIPSPHFKALEVEMEGGLALRDPFHGRRWNTSITANVDPVGLQDRTHLSLQDDGNLVVLDFKPLWASNTRIAYTPMPTEVRVLDPGVEMTVGKFYTSGSYSLVFQEDGNLVVYTPQMTPVWFSGTSGRGAVRAGMQGDGNFVISNAAGQPIWNTGTAGFPGAYAQIQANGNFVIALQTPIWGRFGFTPVPARTPKFLIEFGPYTVWEYKF